MQKTSGTYAPCGWICIEPAPRLKLWLLLATILLTLCSGVGAAPVVINEVCYDPLGVDSGFEWIELYNAGGVDLNLEGALILSGGSTLQQVYVLPNFILRAGRYLLIGEAQIAQAIFNTPLGFQNGGSETDGIRFVAPDGSYTDTVLYDSPNLYGLPDDSGNAGVSFAPDVPEGRSLARRLDGLDSDDCAADFLSEANPTPGLPNHVYVDYALLHPQAWQESGEWRFSVWVKNLSPFATQAIAELLLTLDENQIASDQIPPLAPADSTNLSYVIPATGQLLEATLFLYDDPDTGNNNISLILQNEQLLPPLINEVMYDPGTGKQEWIELWLPPAPARGDFIIEDAAGHSFGFTLPGLSGYYVLCANSLQLLNAYPDCPRQAAIDVESWAVLNNEGDTIFLYDGEFNLLDQMTYVGQSGQQGRSLERYLDDAQLPAWRYSLVAQGATPGQPNSQTPSVPDFTGSFHLTGSPCNARTGGSVTLWYQLPDEANRINCYVYDRAGHRVRVLADNQAISAQGSVVWDGRDNRGKYLSRGLYIILWESQPDGGGKILRRQFTAALYD